MVCVCGVRLGANNRGREESVQGIHKSKVGLLDVLLVAFQAEFLLIKR